MSAHWDNEAEQAVLGAILLGGGDVLASVRGAGLRPEHFYRDTYGSVYAAMVRLHAEGRPIDKLTVRALVKDQADVSEAEIEALAAVPPFTGHAAEYARVVVENARWRWRERAVMKAQTAVQERAREDYAEQINRAVRELGR